MKLEGYALAGKSQSRDRVENDFYATSPKAINMLLDTELFGTGDYLEPCAGMGHISKQILEKYNDANVTNIDIIDRGSVKDLIISDFLDYQTNKKFDYIITNPPYSLGKEFVEKGMEFLKDSGKMAMFLRINFLEGEKRKMMFNLFPPKYIYVFTKRMPILNNGNALDENGKPWATTFCNAWFIWEKGFLGEPIVRWL